MLDNPYSVDGSHPLAYGQDKAEKSIRTSDGCYLSTGSRSRARVRSSALGRV